MTNEERKVLIQYRLAQANTEIREIKILIDNQLLNIAVSRIYYTMFHSLTALALYYGFQTSKHAQLLGWFNKDFIKTGIFEQRYGQILYSAFENRTESDYGTFVSFEKDEVLAMTEETKDFVNRIEEYLQQLL